MVPRPAPTRALVVLTQDGSPSANIAGSSSHGSRLASHQARGKVAASSGRAMLRRRGEQLVDEAVLAAAQAQAVEPGRGEQLAGIDAARMRRGEDDRHGLTRRSQHHDRGRRSDRRGDWHVHGHIEAGTARAVTSQACRRRAEAYFFRGWARSSAGEHCLDTAGATGSIPVAPTIQPKEFKHLASSAASIMRATLVSNQILLKAGRRPVQVGAACPPQGRRVRLAVAWSRAKRRFLHPDESA